MNRLRVGVYGSGLVMALGFGVLAVLARLPHPPLPAPSPAERSLALTLLADITTLAVTIGERNVTHHEALVTAADWLERELARDGYGTERQRFEAQHSQDQNVIASTPGSTDSAEIVVVGAHYDTVLGSPGADDNGSGVAGMKAIAHLLAHRHFRRAVRFVAFANEEYGFATDQMGSRVYARRCKAAHETISAMLCLETMGHFVTEPGSQRYPLPPLAAIYPDRGDFVGVIGNTRSWSLARGVANGIASRTPFPTQWAALPESVPGATWSDHWSFWAEGYPAVMVTDTAPFRDAFYHTPQDLPDKIQATAMARVVLALAGTVADLADAP